MRVCVCVRVCARARVCAFGNCDRDVGYLPGFVHLRRLPARPYRLHVGKTTQTLVALVELATGKADTVQLASFRTHVCWFSFVYGLVVVGQCCLAVFERVDGRTDGRMHGCLDRPRVLPGPNYVYTSFLNHLVKTVR